MNQAPPLPDRLILFDGVCAVCDASMTWIIDHDVEGRFHYAPLQGATAEQARRLHPEIPGEIDSIVYIDRTGPTPVVRWYSDAILHIAAELPAPWRLARVLLWVPRPVRDLAYRAFARVRYRVFGKLDQCRLPTEAEQAVMLP